MRKAQFAIEYLLVVGFSILLTLPILWYLYKGYDDVRQNVNVEHMNEVARELAFQIERVYYQGPNSRIEIAVFFPRGVKYAHINQTNNQYIGYVSLALEGFEGTIEQIIRAELCDNYTLDKFSGPHNIMINVTSDNCVTVAERR